MENCLFCKVIAGTIPAQKVFEDTKVVGFKDLKPQAKIHHLFIHRMHTHDVSDLMKKDPTQMMDLFEAMRHFAEKEGINNKGYRIVTNLGADAGQTVFHTHFHFLAGEPLGHFGA